MARYFSTTVPGVGQFVTSTPMRTFSHAVVIHKADSWVLDGFRGTEALAVAGVRSVKVRWGLRKEREWPVYILPAVEIEKAEYQAFVAAVIAAGSVNANVLSVHAAH